LNSRPHDPQPCALPTALRPDSTSIYDVGVYGHVPRPRNFIYENKFSREDFLANVHWQFCHDLGEIFYFSRVSTPPQHTANKLAICFRPCELPLAVLTQPCALRTASLRDNPLTNAYACSVRYALRYLLLFGLSKARARRSL
jgi:hypothetical protein